MPRTCGDLRAWLGAMLDVPRIFAAGVEAERKRMDAWCECRALGLDVDRNESLESLTAKREKALKGTR